MHSIRCESLNPGKVIPTLQRCAEYGKMHVHRGMLPFPELAEVLMDSQDPVLARLIDRVRSRTSRRMRRSIFAAAAPRVFYGEPPRGEPLDVSPLAGISCYEPTELVVTVRAGTPLRELEAALEEQGQCLPFEPPRFSDRRHGGRHGGGGICPGLRAPVSDRCAIMCWA